MEYKGVIEKTILMKVTSRGRPQQLIHAINEYLRLASNPKAMTWLITLDHDDDKCNTVSFCDSLGHILDEPNIAFGHSDNKIHAINRDVNQLHIHHWDILLNISDDQLPIVQGYDAIIREAMPITFTHLYGLTMAHKIESILRRSLAVNIITEINTFTTHLLNHSIATTTLLY